jgi:hypothetical protein
LLFAYTKTLSESCNIAANGQKFTLEDPTQYGDDGGRVIDPASQDNSETRFRSDSTGLTNNFTVNVVGGGGDGGDAYYDDYYGGYYA